MSEGLPDPSNSYLEPPSKTTEMEDAGAEGNNVSSSEEDHFSDASEGHTDSQPRGRTSPVPRTRVERVDSSVQHGEIPGTLAFEKRDQDAVPDEIEVVPEGSHSRSHSPAVSLTPGDSPIPQTMVEKVDPSTPSYGEVPGTEAFDKHRADAVPDVITKTSEPGDSPTPPSLDPISQDTGSTTATVPETRLSQVESLSAEEELSSHPRAHRRSPSDTLPDTVETIPDASVSESTTLPTHTRQKSTLMGGTHNTDGGEGQPPADDFDEFVEEQDDMGDDDFGNFDDGFQEPSAEVAEAAPTDGSITPQHTHAPSAPPLTNFDAFKTTSELLSALQGSLDSLLPASQDLGSLPAVEPIPDSAAIFSTERSLSLWSQLVAPPPLQPQNWVKSRIRRLFLVSLGVPVDLDEILPASKQKKLVLPSIDLEGSGATTPGGRSRSQSCKEGEASQNDPDTAASIGQASTRQKTTSRRGAPPPPDMDLSAVRRLCATTDAALSGLTDAELKRHVHDLEQVARRASELLEYWLKRRDGLVSEKEAFEGVIENLVSHVRRVRK
ncbi:hypothetical protein NUU61_005105 [Penicillium alfredii]|uniref:Uncharacterized protein n=1 Tax=Penicillium alfredii TaxID=1506179 RepID=A0A9W9F945_9EURO|nr:uncharacterized protein NUU61_005105 [Penicillium alfredii]KAJ5095749.1 hypothetical protein NUU61_005105 [Penicillium alfredii]